MRKRLIACVIATASLSAYADVNLYGRMAVGLEQDDFQNTTIPGTANVQDFGSYFGIRGNDHVYGETTAIWQLEQFLDITSGQAYSSTTAGGLIAPYNGNIGGGYVKNDYNTLASSESYLGLQGIWGGVRLGNLSNYMRSSMGAIDTFNYANGVNGLGTYSRSSRVVPTSLRYDSPTWGGFNFSAMYSFQTNGGIGVSGLGSSTNFGSGLNGVYSAGIWTGGLGWSGDNFSVKLGTMITQQVGTYTTGTSGMVATAGSQAAYQDAYIDRLELGYEDPDGMIIGLGLQVSDGQGWWSWANSGGSMNNIVYNPGFNVGGLTTNQYQTQEAALSFGWHIGPWTPKVAYAIGNNMMYGGNVLSIATGSASQIANSGYQNAVAELDWNITPKTIVFVNAGQVWWGETLQNISYAGYNNGGQGTVNGNNQAFANQSSVAVGFTHTF